MYNYLNIINNKKKKLKAQLWVISVWHSNSKSHVLNRAMLDSGHNKLKS